jgi:Fatty acid desaturase
MTITPPSVLKPILHPRELAQLAERKSWRALMGIGRVYGSLLFVISLALWFGGLAMVVGFFIVAGLQHALSILQHEAVHGLLFRRHRLNDWWGHIFYRIR